tara:strand:+ start:1535 stop:1882 length:348 start_codon:yes stop_codon:yes gene_type:complete
MKANELRIGNWVNVLDRDYEVTAVLERGINCGLVGCLYSLVKPIPLTEEWLLRFGFENVLNVGIYRKGALDVDYAGGLECLSFSIIDSNYDFTIKHVHQLQNIHHALTGEELEFK